MKIKKKNSKVILLCIAIIEVVTLVACNKKSYDEPATENMSVTELSTELENTEDIVTADNCLSDGKVIVQPTKDSENYFSEEVEITNYVEPDENGHYVVWETPWTLRSNRKTLSEEVEQRKDEINMLGASVIETKINSDNSVCFVFDEDNYKKLAYETSSLTNRRVGTGDEKISIRKDFKEVIMYVNRDKELIDFYTSLSIVSWHIFECQVYSGVPASDQKIVVKIANDETGKILTEIILSMEMDFEMSEEEWNALFVE